ncbi:hypothetical protein ACI3KX_02225 [Microbacterium sp. ZW CA_36]|uniref:hypothetical protein n=1 Tax=Microbacterium sp. ZW CA_36 TaxID=3378078 RepID=UPI0038522266
MTSATPPDIRLNDPWTALNVTTYAAGIVYLLFLAPWPRVFWIFASEFGLSIAVTTAWRVGKPFWLEAIIVVATVVLIEVLRAVSLPVLRRPSVLQRLSGRPAFRDLELMPLSQFKFLLRCIGGLKFTFDAEGEALMRSIGTTDEIMFHDALKRQYVAKYGDEGWAGAWEQIRSASVGETTFATAMKSGLVGIISLKRRTLSDMLVVPVLLYFSLSFLLLSDALVRGDPLILLQATLVGGLMVSGLSFAQMTVMLRHVTVLDPDEQFITQSEELLISDEARARMDEATEEMRGTDAYAALKRHAGAVFLPTVEIRPLYISSVRTLVVQLVFFLALGGALVCVPLLILQWLGGLAFSEWPPERLALWSGWMLLGTALIPLGMSLAVLFGFWLFTQFNRFLALAMAAVLTAIVPSVLAYALGVESAQTVAITALVTAAVGSVPIAVAELIKKQPAATVPSQLASPPTPDPASAVGSETGTREREETPRPPRPPRSRSEERARRNAPAPGPSSEPGGSESERSEQTPPPPRPSRPLRRRPPSTQA